MPGSLFLNSSTILDTEKNYKPPLFTTHHNYIKRLDLLFKDCQLTVSKFKAQELSLNDINSFKKLYSVTLKSIQKDIELSKENNTFSIIAAPWFPVKCYYAIYYLESIFIYLIDSKRIGFGKKGHQGVRKQIAQFANTGVLKFSNS